MSLTESPARDDAARGAGPPRPVFTPWPLHRVIRATARTVRAASRLVFPRHGERGHQPGPARFPPPTPAPHRVPDVVPVGEPKSFPAIYNTASWMHYCERVVLYAMVYGVRPKRVLEIGTFRGGSTLIMAAALDDVGDGRIVCVDPDPQLAPETIDQVSHRATVLAAPSPECLADAERLAGGKFDFALIDGDHTQEGVVRDAEGVLGVILPYSYLLFHDAHYEPVRRGIHDFWSKRYWDLQDCGMLSTCTTPDANNPEVRWGGIRVLRYTPATR